MVMSFLNILDGYLNKQRRILNKGYNLLRTKKNNKWPANEPRMENKLWHVMLSQLLYMCSIFLPKLEEEEKSTCWMQFEPDHERCFNYRWHDLPRVARQTPPDMNNYFERLLSYTGTYTSYLITLGIVSAHKL